MIKTSSEDVENGKKVSRSVWKNRLLTYIVQKTTEVKYVERANDRGIKFLMKYGLFGGMDINKEHHAQKVKAIRNIRLKGSHLCAFALR